MDGNHLLWSLPGEVEGWPLVTDGPVEIRQLWSEDEFRRGFKLMQQLRPHLTLDVFLEILPTMLSEGYEMWTLLDDGEFKALSGISIRTNSFYGRYLWIFDLVTAEGARSKGYGARLLLHLEQLARQRGCDVVALSSRVDRVDAHRFYQEKMGYDNPSLVFKKELNS